MRIVCPYTQLHPATRAALEPLGAEFFDVSASDWEYWELVKRLWADGRAWIHVEHDLEPTRQQITQLARCPEPVCAIAYSYPGVPRLVDFGFMKLGRAGEAPPPVDFSGRWSVLPHGERWHWRDVSCYVKGRLPSIHVHPGLVRHHKES